MKRLLLAVSAIIISVNLMAQGIEFEHGTFAEALVKAKAENKLVFMDCYTTWCGPCKMLAKNVFPQQVVGDVFNAQFVNIKMDCEKGEGPEVAKKYGIGAYPSLLFMDAEGKVLHKAVGGTNVDGLIEHAGIAVDPSKQIAAMHKRYADGDRDIKFLSAYIKTLHSAYEHDKSLSIGREFIANTPTEQLINVDAFTVISYSNALVCGSETYNYIIANKNKFIETEGVGHEKYVGIIRPCIINYLYDKTSSCTSIDELKAEIAKIKKDFVSPRQEMMESELINAYYLEHKEYDNWFESSEKDARETLEKDKNRGLSMLINMAYRVARDPAFANIEGVYDGAIELVNLAKETDPEIIAPYHCLASLYKASGEKDKALENINIYMAKNLEKGGQNNIRVDKLKKDIEAM